MYSENVKPGIAARRPYGQDLATDVALGFSWDSSLALALDLLNRHSADY